MRKFKLRAIRTHRVLDVLMIVVASALISQSSQTARAQTAKPATSGFDFGAKKVTARTNGVRLDGNAFIKSPQLDARANTVAFDFAGRAVTNVRAQGAVNLKVNLLPRGGGTAARIETKSNAATLDPVNRILVLTGNISGFYQLQGGARNSLSGNKATISYPANGQFIAVVEGGTGGVRIVLPQVVGAAPGAGNLGTVVVTARNLSINSQDGTATFAGNARAFSNDGATKFDIAAPSFVLRRNAATSALESLRSTGRTLLKVDLPQNAAAATPTSSTPSATSGNASTAARPTYIEVASDAVVVLGGANGAQLGTLTFDGNVSGFYRLVGSDGAVSNFPFKGDHAVIQNTGAGSDNFQLEVTGAPVEIQAPTFDLGF